jgi:DGQHR domain-containing protein
MPVPVNGFVADSVEVQREQFLRVNSTKPLPRGLVTELLPEVSSSLRADWATRRIASGACEFLNRAEESPFRGLIRRASLSETARRRAVVADTGLVRMIEDSLSSPLGCLFTYRNLATGTVDLAGLRRVLVVFWQAVRDEFPQAWGLPPSRSRLMHSAGIRAMGRLMDRLMVGIDVERSDAVAAVRRELRRVRPVCRWTDGAWEDLQGLRWNEIQNVPSHLRGLSDLLVRTYLGGRAHA